MTGRLEGKVALVTGAARGTGAAIAEHFVAEGAVVTVADVLDDRGQETADRIGASFRHLDVTSEADWAAAVDALDRIDVLVNNAAVLHLATIDLTTAEAFERILKVNVLGPFLGTKACLPKLRQSSGSIVNVGSIDSVHGVTLTSAYTSSKFGLRGLTKVTAIENGRWGVRANIVCPAAGNPEMHPRIVGAEDWPTGDHLTPEERHRRGPGAVAPAVVYLASDESKLVNGTELVIDDGQTAGERIDLPDSVYGIS
ncbi:MAG: 3-alpha-hydroxysteroid dehydrogenase [Actinomycetia bacterium]|nr:3-alpha-hydroxysteroid dehydrogenase [Actinomycetes bacterium]